VNKRYIVGAIVAVVAVVAVLVGVSLSGGDSTTVSTLTGADAAKAEFAGLDQSGSTVGKASAPVEIIEYGDTSCPICRDASKDLVPAVIDRWVRTGEAKMTFRPVAFISPSSERGALGAEAAAMQDAIWPFVTLIYANQGPEQEDWLSDALLKEAATDLGLDVPKWQSDYESEAVASAYFTSDNQWKAAGGTGTPTFEIIGPKGKQVFEGAQDISKFEEAINTVS
jgi:protein-disulfide isomerase